MNWQRVICFWRHHRHHPHTSAAKITDHGLTNVRISIIKGKFMATVTGNFTAPVVRKSGAALALTDIDHFSLTRNGSEIQKLAPTGPVISYTDTTPLSGADTYDVFTITKPDGFTSDSSNDANVVIVTADPAVAITDLTATVSP